MSGELQTIPARHGVATFVPRGRTIKIINTYGKQVVSMWGFALGAPPEDEDDDATAGDIEKEAQEVREAAEEEEKTDTEASSTSKEGEFTQKQEGEVEDGSKETTPSPETTEDDPPEQTRDTPESEKPTGAPAKQSSKRTWASYLPSIPYRSKGSADKQGAEKKPDAESEKAQNEVNTKKWSSYLSTGKGISNYVPNVQVPDTKDVMSAFKTSHYRDPNKSYAEQLYDFSKTPVGAGTIAAATGSGYASSVYAAYTAYTTTHPYRSSQAPMEYLSLPHTRASAHKLVPTVNDTLLTNLRNPIVTLIEDTTPGAHDTLTAACDANFYAALDVERPAEHGSCAENLVMALKELNEEAGLKGSKAIGADISVNIAPTPLHLFMAAPIELDGSQGHDAGAGAKGATLRIEEPTGKKRSFVRFKAERDVVLVFSACPMDVGKQNGGRCMAANFMVEDAEAGEAEKKGTSIPATEKDATKKDERKSDGEVSTKQSDSSNQGGQEMDRAKSEATPTPATAPATANKTEAKSADAPPENAPTKASTPKKKPKKLEVRSKPAEGSA